jgi:hypothetical protein
MMIAHKIGLDPTNKQATYFARASGLAWLGLPTIGGLPNGSGNIKSASLALPNQNHRKCPYAAN